MPALKPLVPNSAVAARWNRLLWAACLSLAFALPLGTALALWWTPAPQLLRLPGATVFRPWQHLLATAVLLLPALLAGWGLWQARRCFACFGRGEFFSSATVASLHGLATGMLGASIAGLLAPTLAMLVLSWERPAGHRTLLFDVGSQQLLTLLFAGLVWQFAAALQRGMALAQENEAFV